MINVAEIVIPARSGKAAFARAGQAIKVINTYGQQVVDTWAFNAQDIHEFMSMEHSRQQMLTIFPTVGVTLLTNHRRPILTFIEDTSSGIHDTLIAACDRYRYERLGYVGDHDNCTDNLRFALKEFDLTPPETPCPLNLFMNIPIQPNGKLSIQPPVSTPGSFVTFRAEMDVLMVFSACPQDMVPVNGVNCTPTEAHFQVFDL